MRSLHWTSYAIALCATTLILFYPITDVPVMPDSKWTLLAKELDLNVNQQDPYVIDNATEFFVHNIFQMNTQVVAWNDGNFYLPENFLENYDIFLKDLQQNSNAECYQDIKTIMSCYLSLKTKAMDTAFQCASNSTAEDARSFMDSLGWPNISLLHDGFHLWLGKYDKCMAVPECSYCSLYTPQYYLEDYIFGLCLPSSCGSDDRLKGFIQALVKHESIFETYAKFRLPPKIECFRDQKISRVTIPILVTWILLIASCILMETRCSCCATNIFEFCRKIGIWRKYKQYFEVNSQRTNCLDGLKVISMITVVLGHYGSIEITSITNQHFVKTSFNDNIIHHIHFRFFILCMDLFFIISGILNVNCLNDEQNFVTFWIKYLARRVFRLWPMILALLLFSNNGYVNLGRGPMWNSIHLPEANCPWSSWCYHLTFTTNWLISSRGYNATCLLWLWFIAINFQIYIYAPFFVKLLKNSRKHAIIVVFLLELFAIVAHCRIMFANNFPPDLILYINDNEKFNIDVVSYMELYYLKLWSRISKYAFGLLIGGMMLEPRVHHHFLKYKRLYTSFVLFAAIWPLVGMYPTMIRYFFNPFYNLLYAILARLLWSLAAAVIILLCISHQSGFLNQLLGHRIFTIFSPLCYAVYISHPLVLIYFSRSSVTTFMYTDCMSWFLKSIKPLILCYAVGALLFLFIEIPFANFGKLIAGHDLRYGK